LIAPFRAPGIVRLSASRTLPSKAARPEFLTVIRKVQTPPAMHLGGPLFAITRSALISAHWVWLASVTQLRTRQPGSFTRSWMLTAM
jgi:hypothetical protein